MLELTGAEDAPGVKEGGVLEQVTRELKIEALPNDIPGLAHPRRVGDADRRHDHPRVDHAAGGVTFLDDPETVIATLTPPGSSSSPTTRSSPRPRSSARARRAAEAEGAAEGGDAGAGGDSERRVGRGHAHARARGGAPVDWLIVGLGNPGAEYARHPAQHRLRDRRALIERWELPKPKSRYRGLLTEGRHRPGPDRGSPC